MALIWLYRDFDQVLGVWGVRGGLGWSGVDCRCVGDVLGDSGGHMHNITIISRPFVRFPGQKWPLIWLYRDFDQVWGVWGGSGVGLGWIVGVLGVCWETLGGHMYNITIISRPFGRFPGQKWPLYGPYMALS